jgi:Neuraminidase (sialidase)
MEGRLYCAWVDLTSGFTEPTVDASLDGGQTWGTDTDLYSFEPGGLSGQSSATGIIIKADATGRVHAVWADARTHTNHVYYSYSDDQAATWQPASKVDDSSAGLYASPEAFDADVSVDGGIYVVWSDARHEVQPPHSNRDIFSDVRAHDGTFGTDVMVNTETDNVQQEFPAVAVGLDGVVHCAWSDNRNSGDNGGPNPILTYEPFYARSEDGGATWGSEQKIPVQSPGYNSFNDINPRIKVSPWGNPYVSYVMKRKEIHLSSSCDGGDTWANPVVAYVVAASCYLNHNVSMGLMADGTIFVSYIDSRAQPGYPSLYWNVWMSRSD